MTDKHHPMSFDDIATEAARIYDERFRERYEGEHDDEFLVIDVDSEEAYHGKYPEDALAKAEKTAPDGTLYMIKVGSPAAFSIGYTGG